MSDCVTVEERGKSSSCVAEVFPIKMEPHPNADSLSIIRKDEYTIVVKTDDWKDGQLAVHITPDTMVNVNRPIFSWVPDADPEGWARVRSRRFRGVYSYGFLIPFLGTEPHDMWDELGLKRYEPPVALVSGGENIATPFYHKFEVYDLESWMKHGKLLREGEGVVVTEKLHGMNARFVFWEGEFYAGSHYTWKKKDPRNIVWQAVSQNPWVMEMCVANPGVCFYGEIYGQVQNLKYGTGKDELRVAIFDAMDSNDWWWPAKKLLTEPTIKEHPPVLYVGPYSRQLVIDLSMGDSTVPNANHIREGAVIEAVNRRLKLKLVSPDYLSRK